MANTEVQTLIFDKEKFSRDEAIAWAQDHQFSADKVDETEYSYRIRQRDPSEFVDGSFRSIELVDGVRAVIGKPKQQAVAPNPANLESAIWAIDPRVLASTVRDLRAAHTATGTDASMPHYSLAADGTATIQIHGVILQKASRALGLFGIAATGCAWITEAITAAVVDDAVGAIVLDIDSPGGTIAGVQDVADTVFATRGLKPITARVSSLAASAAYWIASQADTIEASQTAEVGSIGVYRVLIDTSASASSQGIAVHVIRSGPHKGAGVDGAPITAEQLIVEQEMIDKACDMFIEAVARGRGMSEQSVRAIATGRTWFAADARTLGLIDQVVGFTAGEINMEKENMATIKEDAERLLAEVAQLKAQNDAFAAKVAASDAALAVAREAQRDVLLAKYRERVTPAMEPHVRRYADACMQDLKQLDDYLQALPVVTRSQQVGVAAAEDLQMVMQRCAVVCGECAEACKDMHPECAEKCIECKAACEAAMGKEEPAQAKIAAGDEYLSRAFGNDPREVERFAKVRGITTDGKLVLADGTETTMEEMN